MMIRLTRENDKFGFGWNDDKPLISANWQGWFVIGLIIMWVLL